MAKKALQMHGRGEPDPSETLRKANRELYGELETGTFLTVFYAILDMDAREVRCCRAGHNPALVVSGGPGPEVAEIQPGGMGVGINDGSIFEKTLETMTLPLEDGTSVVLYTDGVTESRNDAGEEYGVGRLKKTLARFAEFRPTYLIHLIRADLETFSDHRAPDDDQTIICIRVG
jgi:sigma-B regulation protein RsbU (phosphoserine phosphatase)